MICVLVLSISRKYGVTKQKAALFLRNNVTGFGVWRRSFLKICMTVSKGTVIYIIRL
jgi:hypothetical protein